MKINLLILTSLLLVFSSQADTSPSPATGTVKGQARQISLIPLRSITFAEAEPVLRSFLTEEGRLVYFDSRNAIVVIDQSENVAVIKQVLEEIDTPAVNVRISVSFDTQSSGSEARVGAETGGIRITRSVGGKTTVEGDVFVGAGLGRTESSERSTQFVLTRSNRPARIWVGETVAEPLWVFEYGIRHGWWRRELVWQDIGASLWVQPRVLGDNMIEVEVFPRITVRGDQPLALDVKEVSTNVVVQNGQSMSLGGLDQEQRDFYVKLLGIGRIFNGRSLAITLRADIVAPGSATQHRLDY